MSRTIARIYLSHLEHNIKEIRTLAPNKKICMALKANAYGHGAVEVARKALDLDIDYFSVATVSEGVELRKSGITIPILLLGICNNDEIEELVLHNLTPLVADAEFVDILHKTVLSLRKESFPVHLKIDTGMARHGCLENDALTLASYITSKSPLFIEGICTHFAVSDSVLQADIDFTKKQIALFSKTVNILQKAGIDTGILHCAASGGILLHPDSLFDMVRPGILCYGYFPSTELHGHFKNAVTPKFIPVMELVTHVTALKELEKGSSVSYGRTWIAKEKTNIATLALGYADGFSRNLSENVDVTIGNKRYAVIGRICMDMCVIAIKNDSVKRWSEAIVFGPNNNCNSALDIANKLHTIPYEVLCLITSRVTRVYVK